MVTRTSESSSPRVSTPSSRASRRSASFSWALSSRAWDRSALCSTVLRRSAPVRSAYARFAPVRSAPPSRAPRSETYVQPPPRTVIGNSVAPANTLPVILQPSRVASNSDARWKRQRRNALFSCVETLSFAPEKSHSTNTTPRVVVSLRSASTNRQLRKTASPSSRPYQSAPVKSPSMCTGRPYFRDTSGDVPLRHDRRFPPRAVTQRRTGHPGHSRGRCLHRDLHTARCLLGGGGGELRRRGRAQQPVRHPGAQLGRDLAYLHRAVPAREPGPHHGQLRAAGDLRLPRRAPRPGPVRHGQPDHHGGERARRVVPGRARHGDRRRERPDLRVLRLPACPLVRRTPPARQRRRRPRRRPLRPDA